MSCYVASEHGLNAYIREVSSLQFPVSGFPSDSAEIAAPKSCIVLNFLELETGNWELASAN